MASYHELCAQTAAETFITEQALGDKLVPVGGKRKAAASSCFLVIRHNGRGMVGDQGQWRVVGWRSTEAEAQRLYAEISKDLRQGLVALFHAGRIVKISGSPRLRSIW